MSIAAVTELFYLKAKENKWMRYFTTFCRLMLALGFIPSGIVKILGERFTSLSVNHPMGQYLEALHHTGYYYTFIGIAQVTAAVLLLIPRTALLGALIYFPVILNICILSFAVRFDGSLLSSPLMVLATLYLLCWDYDRLRYILPSRQPKPVPAKDSKEDNRFPLVFFMSAFATVALTILIISGLYEMRPRNTLGDCRIQCKDSSFANACEAFCDCIHNQGIPLDKCLEAYQKAKSTLSR